MKENSSETIKNICNNALETAQKEKMSSAVTSKEETISAVQLKEKAEKIVSQMTLEEKAGMCSGKNFWQTKSVERLGIPSILLTDGPHGLRKQAGSFDNLGVEASLPATCFPTSATTACSFDLDLMKRIGKALGEECLKERVSVILGPGVNIKRSPLCGRNFEYFSEDPYLAGKMAAAHIKGVQSKGVGTSLKHFAANNQEKKRMTISAMVNERTLRDIYLRPFEIAVKEAKPWTVMCSYNKINNVYSSENRWLLTKVLREEWGFEGLVVSDWGSVHNRAMGVNAGLDLEMPGSLGINDKKIVDCINNNIEFFDVNDTNEKLAESLDISAKRVVELALKAKENLKENYSFEKRAHHELAVEALEKSAVLLKNEGSLLPLNPDNFINDNQISKQICIENCNRNSNENCNQYSNEKYKQSSKLAIIGELFRKPRFQGAGSSKINPFKVDSAEEVFDKMGILYEFSRGYLLKEKQNTIEEDYLPLIEEAKKIAENKETVIIFAGLTEGYESEGFDRSSMDMPTGQIKLINEICKINNNVVVVLSGGSPMNISWFDKARAVLLSYLGGEGVGKAIANILFGKTNPSGKLAETWPLKLEDNPSFKNFPGNRLMVKYEEGIFVGYRYYDIFDIPVRFPFGYGLSYSAFEYTDLIIKNEELSKSENLELEFKIRNTTKTKGAETALIFVAHKSANVSLPKKELRAFKKVELGAFEERTVEVNISFSELGYYNTEISKRYTESGEYKVIICKNVNEEILEKSFFIKPYEEIADGKIYHPGKNACDYEEFFNNLEEIGNEPAKRPFTMENNFVDTKETFLGRIILYFIRKTAKKMEKNQDEQAAMIEAMVTEMPFFSLVTSSEGRLKPKVMEGLLLMLNGHFFRGLFKMVKR